MAKHVACLTAMSDKSVTAIYDCKPLRRPDGRGFEFAAVGIASAGDGKTLY